MGLHAVEERERLPWVPAVHHLYPVTETISGPSGATGTAMMTGVIAGITVNVVGLDWLSNATTGMSVGGMYYAGASEYDPEFVASILLADAEPPEASFNNVVDMLDWLNRD